MSGQQPAACVKGAGWAGLAHCWLVCAAPGPGYQCPAINTRLDGTPAHSNPCPHQLPHPPTHRDERALSQDASSRFGAAHAFPHGVDGRQPCGLSRGGHQVAPPWVAEGAPKRQQRHRALLQPAQRHVRGILRLRPAAARRGEGEQPGARTGWVRALEGNRLAQCTQAAGRQAVAAVPFPSVAPPPSVSRPDQLHLINPRALTG